MAVQNKQQIQNPFGFPPMVQQMAEQQFAMKNGGAMQGNGGATPPPVATVPPQNVFAGGGVMGKFEAQPGQGANAYQSNFEGMEKPQQFQPQGVESANPQSGTVVSPPMKNAADVTPQPQTNFENAPQPATGWNQDGTPRYDTISDALSGYKHDFTQQQPEFRSDPSKRDGGFFSWLKGIMPKSRPGMRDGETEDEYDRRMTTNKERLLALGDALRHIGNIVNTNKYAPSQQFNDPYSAVEQGYQQRSAQRRQKEAAEADAAYKQANMTLKERAAEADRQYKAMNLGFKQAAEDRARKKADDDNKKWAANYERLLNNDAYNHKMAEDKFKESQRHNQVSEGQGAMRIALSQERNKIARARLAHSIATGGDGGKAVSMTNLSTPAGHVNRNKDLNTIEKKQLTQYLIKNGYINKKNMDAFNTYNSTNDVKALGDLQNGWIAFAANLAGKKGDQFRRVLRDHYGYVETQTTSVPSGGGKSVVTITQKGNKGAKPQPSSNKTKFHVK